MVEHTNRTADGEHGTLLVLEKRKSFARTKGKKRLLSKAKERENPIVNLALTPFITVSPWLKRV